jgi:hypothetical protein
MVYYRVNFTLRLPSQGNGTFTVILHTPTLAVSCWYGHCGVVSVLPTVCSNLKKFLRDKVIILHGVVTHEVVI